MRKQYSDENTGLNELNNYEEIPNPEEKTSSSLNTKNNIISPFICPQIPKSYLGNFKLGSDPKDQIQTS